MATVKVITRFWDKVEQVDRVAGDVFEATDARAAEIAELLPGYVEVEKEQPKAEPKAAPKRRTTRKTTAPKE